MKLLLSAVVFVVAVGCDPVEYAAVVVAPPPAIRADSSARAEFWRRATGVARRVAESNALTPRAKWVAPDPRASLECLGKGAFSMCIVPGDSLLRLEFTEGCHLYRQQQSYPPGIFDSLQLELGERSVRECWSRSWRTLRPDSKCPTLAQMDSGRAVRN